MTSTFYHYGKQGGKVYEFPNFFLFFFFRFPFGLVFWLLAIEEHWKIREKKDFLDLTVLTVC